MIRLLSYLRDALICSLLVVSLFGSPLQANASEQQAMFAGGCFWCLEHDLEAINGVISADSGYAGGTISSPTYRNHEGHQEVVQLKFDPSILSYEELLRSYWRNVDPLDSSGQFCDRGDSYKPVIFVENDDQELSAQESINFAALELDQPIKEIKVEIVSGKRFWLAENYHQDFAEKNPIKYSFYRNS